MYFNISSNSNTIITTTNTNNIYTTTLLDCNTILNKSGIFYLI